MLAASCRGRQLACIPQSVVFHVGGATLKKENPRKTFLNFRNNLVMLYKNLPQEDLASVMRVRAVLDYVAAFSFMLKGQLPNALAVSVRAVPTTPSALHWQRPAKRI